MSLVLAISVGDPAGIGPEVTVRALEAELGRDAALVFGDARALEPAFRAAGIALAAAPTPGAVTVVDQGRVPEAAVAARAPTAEGGRFQHAALLEAAHAVMEGRAHVLVTGPVSKAAVELSGVPFTGQTEALAELAGLAHDEVTMMFLGPRLNVALVTTHLSVIEAAKAVTAERVARATLHLAEALGRLHEGEIEIAITGVNPHAGEGGLFGREEIDAVRPGVERARPGTKAKLVGPMPAEAAFRAANEGRVHGVVAMLHDQATIASKLLDWGDAVNVTWGLPFVRASVDHGVAYDIAGQGVADAAGMRAAIRLAKKLGAP
ncbi:MAG: 4-hydroxythreonine-4-phosphate dehydrogenase [Myxococcales bacterium]|nr:4-hydroxythreonine-4-phosphate dehydrogenase [Myxococcales bacterium]